jgi:cbb3-type cytochrome oxidase subunit 3
LDLSIEETLERREFAWRMPRETVEEGEREAKGPLEAAIKWLLDALAQGIRTLGKWITQLFEWLENFLPQPDKKPASTNKNWITPVRAVLVLLFLLFLAVLTFVFFRIRRRRRTGTIEAAVVGVAPLPDLNDESTSADELPANRWLVLAEEFSAKGELRLAMRALYLATLAYLAEQELITIEVYKSNREYEQELKRRAHDREEMLSIFSKSLNLFERVWYGMYRIPRSDFNDFAMNQKKILTVVKER